MVFARAGGDGTCRFFDSALISLPSSSHSFRFHPPAHAADPTSRSLSFGRNALRAFAQRFTSTQTHSSKCIGGCRYYIMITPDLLSSRSDSPRLHICRLSTVHQMAAELSHQSMVQHCGSIFGPIRQYHIFPDEALVEKKAQEITRNSPATYIFGKRY